MSGAAPPPFTAHNILLPDGRQTLPGHELLEDSGRCQAALRDLAMMFSWFPWSQAVRVADLGCLEGGYSVAFARAGYDVTGIEARAENMACCEYVAGQVALPGLRFERADVRDILNAASSDQWEAVYCGGLLYHLDEPVNVLRQLGHATSRLLILDTHYSTHPDSVHEGRRGHWYEEGEGRWAAWGNERSFWLARPDLLEAIREAGFSLVFEQHDHRASMLVEDDVIAPDRRGMFVAIKLDLSPCLAQPIHSSPRPDCKSSSSLPSRA